MELKTLIKETTITQGTGTLTLDGAVTDFRTFSAAFPGVTAGSGSAIVPYEIRAGAVFEEGIGTFKITAGGVHQLARDIDVDESSNSDALVNLAVGTKSVYLVIPASRLLVKDNSNIVGDATSVLTLMGAVDSVQVNEASHGTGVIWHAGRNGASTLTIATKGELNLPNGWKAKWNKLTVAASTTAADDVFANAFPNNFLLAVLGIEKGIDTGAQSGVVSYTRTGLTAITIHNGTDLSKDITYVAIGN